MQGIIFKAKHFFSKDIKRSTWPEKIAKYATFDKALEEFRKRDHLAVSGLFIFSKDVFATREEVATKQDLELLRQDFATYKPLSMPT